jgi:hypothetical protein
LADNARNVRGWTEAGQESIRFAPEYEVRPFGDAMNILVNLPLGGWTDDAAGSLPQRAKLPRRPLSLVCAALLPLTLPKRLWVHGCVVSVLLLLGITGLLLVALNHG